MPVPSGAQCLVQGLSQGWAGKGGAPGLLGKQNKCSAFQDSPLRIEIWLFGGITNRDPWRKPLQEFLDRLAIQLCCVSRAALPLVPQRSR